MPAIAHELIAEVKGAVRGGSPARRAQILRQLAGLFLSNAPRLDERQIGIFDDVMVCVLEQVEARTLTHLSTMLAVVPSAPREVTRRLACHEEANVAVPVLRNSNSLSDIDLIEIADDCSQQHLLAIANRASLGEALTAALLTRADTTVCRALAGNLGARFCDAGYATLTARAQRDGTIADSLVLRLETPATVLGELLAKVTKPERARLVALASPHARGAVQKAIERIEAEASSKPPAPVDYTEASAIVLALSKEGKLADQAVNRFAVHQEQQNLVAALSLLATVETEIFEPLFDQSDGYGLMVACRASRLNWNTTLAVVTHRKNAPRLSPQEVEQRQEAFEALPLSIAQWTIRFGTPQDFAAKLNLPNDASAASGAGT
jgi:uncharacterized protein (DUF2336 family)